MKTRSALLVGVGWLGCGCASAVQLSSHDALQLQAATDIPVIYTKSPAPWVYCPGDIGRQTWEHAGSSNWTPDESTLLAAGGLGGALVPVSAEGPGTLRPAGGTWDEIVDEWTKSLQVPPEDPARATARDFLALAGTARTRLPFRPDAEELATGQSKTLADRFGSAPVLVFRTSEWLLVGCFFKFAPWFNVQAALLEPGSGRVLWRDSCGGGFPNGAWTASPSELDANGRALYLKVIRQRAGRCSKDLFASFERGAANAPPAAR